MPQAPSPRKLAAFGLAALLGVTALPFGAQAAWKGLAGFDCATSRANWNFDGLYGPYTQRAVKAFQKDHHLPISGVCNPQTFAALGMKAQHRTLKCGMGGNDVFLLQQTLAAAGYWYGGSLAPSAAPTKASPTPKPRPTSALPTPLPVTQPSVSASPAPVATPSARASALPSAKPTAASGVPQNRPTLELAGGDWMVPLNAGSSNYDLTFMRPTWTGEGALWLGDVGVGASVVDFNTVFTNYQTTAYFAQNTLMYDGLLKYRFDHGYYQVFAGYRGIGVGDVNFGTLGVGLNRPLLGDWLWLQARAQAGSNFGSRYFLDGQAGLGLRYNILELELGFRHFAFQKDSDPLFNANGPVANLKLQF